MTDTHKNVIVFQLRHLVLEPQYIKCTKDSLIQLRIAHSLEHAHRKFLFLLEEADEESPPLIEGQHYNFHSSLTEATIYSLICLNYPKVRCSIEIENSAGQEELTLEDTSIQKNRNEQKNRASSPLCGLTEVEEKEQEKEAQEQGDNSNSKSDFADYQRILNDQDIRYDYMPNKYLRYFKEQFKLWRDFFEQPTPPSNSPALALSQRKQPSRQASSGSLSLSEQQSERESVISHLRSQQEMSEVQQEQNLNRNKIMKKTNSEYCFNPDREDKPTPSPSKRKQLNTNTSSPNPRTEQEEADTFVDWAAAWADRQKMTPVKIPRLGDRHLVRQWLAFLQNKFKIGEIMYG